MNIFNKNYIHRKICSFFSRKYVVLSLPWSFACRDSIASGSTSDKLVRVHHTCDMRICLLVVVGHWMSRQPYLFCIIIKHSKSISCIHTVQFNRIFSVCRISFYRKQRDPDHRLVMVHHH